MEMNKTQKQFIKSIIDLVAWECFQRLAIGFVGIALFTFISCKFGFGFGFDDTDNLDDGIRSGMVVRVDHLTGCQYLSTPRGGVTPRLDAKGSHLGCDISTMTDR